MDALMLEIKRYIEANQLIRPGDGVVVGLSGGPDSVFLLYALHTLQPRMGFTLRAVHLKSAGLREHPGPCTFIEP